MPTQSQARKAALYTAAVLFALVRLLVVCSWNCYRTGQAVGAEFWAAYREPAPQATLPVAASTAARVAARVVHQVQEAISPAIQSTIENRFEIATTIDRTIRITTAVVYRTLYRVALYLYDLALTFFLKQLALASL